MTKDAQRTAPAPPNRTPGKSLVPLIPDGSELPIFFIHGGDGAAFAFEVIIESMRTPRGPIYAFEAPGLWGDEHLVDHIGEMAQRYVRELVEVYPEGPIILVGYSYGGSLGWLMTELLEHTNRPVALGLIDVWHPRAVIRDASSLEFWRHWLIGIPGNLRLLWHQPWRRKGGFIRRPFRRYMRKLSRRTGVKAFDRLAQGVGRRPPARASEFRLNRPDHEHVEFQPFHGPVGLFRAQRRVDHYPDNYGWDGLALGPYEIFDVPGNHESMLLPPNSAALIQSITDWCDSLAQRWRAEALTLPETIRRDHESESREGDLDDALGRGEASGG